MKKAIVFAAAALMATPAFASKARQAALGGAVTTSDDVQEIFNNPAKMFNFGDLLTVEYGANAEGGFFRSSGDTKYGVYFGNRSTTFNGAVATANGMLAAASASLLNEQNPLEIFYGSKGGDMAWAMSFKYSAGENKTTKAKSESMGLRAGVGTDAYEAYAVVGLSGSSKQELATTNAEIKNEPTIRVGGEYFMGDSTVYADVLTGGAKITNTTPAMDAKATNTEYTVGVESKIKGEGSHFFYGVALKSTETKVGDNKKDTTMKLPVYAGVEADAASWLVVRGFVKQSVLLNSVKNVDTAGATTGETTGTNDTTAGFGAGLKFGKLTVDGTLSTDGNLITAGGATASSVLADVSMNYWF